MRRMFAGLAAAAALSGCTRVFFQPSGGIFARPEDYGARYEVARFPSQDGTELTGLFFPASPGPARGAVVHFHGNGENMTSHFLFSFWLREHGYHVFIFDYRGYGASGGTPDLRGAVQDGAAALRYLRTRPEVDPERMAVFGQSLGAAIALAALDQDGGAGVRALVLESPFASFRSIAQDKLSRFFLTWPLQWPLSRLLFSDRYRPERMIRRLPPRPLLVVHGDADRVVPIEHGRRLFAAAREPKQFWTVPSGRHAEAFTRFGSEFRPRLVGFLSDALSGP